MYIKPEVDTNMIQQQWLQPEMKLVQGNQMKITICWGMKNIFDCRSKLIKGNFSGGGNE